MKVCPVCGHQGSEEVCPRDGTPLAPQSAPAAAPPAPETGDDAVTPVPVKPRPDPLIGTLMEGRYEILGRIGAGGMGVVYRARQAAMDRIVAVKVLLRSLASNEVNVKRFQLEARAASRLSHPNTITIHDFGQTKDGTLYIVMEFLDGESLDRVIAREAPLDPARTVRILSQACRSLAEAHGHGIIHRDLKPDNIFINRVRHEPDFVKVLDFGVAKLKDPGATGDSGTLTQAGMIFGTPKYMSPEQAQSLELDATSDIYALGIILYEMLTGRAPFSGDAPLTILIKHVHETPTPMSELVPEGTIPPALEAVVMKALQKDRRLRQQSADELREELEAALQSFATSASLAALGGTGVTHTAVGAAGARTPTGLGTATALRATTGGPAPQGTEGWDFSGEAGDEGASPRPAPAPRKLAPYLAAGAALLVVGAVAAFLATRGPVERPAAQVEPDAGLARKIETRPPPPPPPPVVDAGRPSQLAEQRDGGPPDGAGSATAAAPTRPAPGPAPTPRTTPPAGSGGEVRPAVAKVRLQLFSTPSGAEIYINGNEFVGMTPTTIQRPKGMVPATLSFRKEGYRDQPTIVDLTANQEVRVSLIANAKPAAVTPPPAGERKAPPPPTPPPTDSGGFGKFGDLKQPEFGKP